MKKKSKKILLICLITILVVFILMNVSAALNAYKLTHFSANAKPLTEGTQLSAFEKIRFELLGLDIPRPIASEYPKHPYKTLKIRVDNNRSLEAWHIRTDSLKQGIVLLFHGYMDEKSTMLQRGEILLDMGYDVLLVDFMGAGGSYGSQTTIGYLEAENVKAVYDYVLQEMREENIYLLGFSMGAAAITKAQSEYEMYIKGIILEATYGTFAGTVAARFDRLNVPRFPMAHLVVFFGGVINGFNPMEANPQDYVKNITVPTLVMCGSKDPNITHEETQMIFDNLMSENKVLKFFPDSAHESYLKKYPQEWRDVVTSFLDSTINEEMY